ncbi:hypothetical protein [Stenotrophomonas sp.]|nr:hypothetical protein [Stenotrophomonas sp.]
MHALTEAEVQSVSGGMSATTKVIIGGALVASPAIGAMLVFAYYANNQC